MADGRDADLDHQELRLKYTELTRKYTDLAERLNRKANENLAIYRLGAFGLRAVNAGLALVTDDQIQVSNARFMHLARSIEGELEPLPPTDGPAFHGLRKLVVAQAHRMLAEQIPLLDTLYREEGSDAVYALRFERSLRGGQWGVTVTAENVTDRTRRDEELSQTRDALLKRERLRVLGELAASIAHDLGNTLRGASFQLASLQEARKDGGIDPAALEAVTLRVEIASEAISRLHEFARTGSLQSTTVRLDHTIAQAAALVDTDFRNAAHPVTVRVDFPELPTIHASPSEMSLLFVNLLRNARDAMPEGGTIAVTGRVMRDAVTINVADQGTGLSDEVQNRLFEPFFTTKGSQGTGLGLWLAAGTMKRLGGSIQAANRPAGGAIFSVVFPLKAPSRRPPTSPKRRTKAPRARSAPAPRRRRRVRRSAKRS
jgi:signal transduction histidine kinase